MKNKIFQSKEPVAKVILELKEKREVEKAKALAVKFGLSFIDLFNYPVALNALLNLPLEICEKYKVAVFLKTKEKIKIAVQDPANKELQQIIQNLAKEKNLKPIIYVTTPKSIDYLLNQYKILLEKEKERKKALLKPKKLVKKEFKTLKDVASRLKEIPTSKLLEVILEGAISLESSDIHIEPQEDKLRIRFRIDGVLQDAVYLDKEVQKSLINRIKFLAKLRLDTSSICQDGRFSKKVLDKNFDFRVSVLPSIYGESVVLRILKVEAKFLTLDELGFSEKAKKLIEDALEKTQGMILNTGPTGSGKTTTLYAILDKLNKEGVKIITLEDPIEYRIKGIVQSQIDEEKGLTFANGLRSILRQDPDIILVGEIRDKETAEIGTRAALTGHLLLSTLHTNNAAGAIVRLIEMGIKPFLLVGAINLIIAQRLVRKICENCKEEFKPSEKYLANLAKILPGVPLPKTLKRGRGCDLCNGTGYKGRTAIVECLKISDQIEKLILKSAPASVIQNQAIKEGMLTMEQDGVLKVIEGITTLEEVWRVTKF